LRVAPSAAVATTEDPDIAKIKGTKDLLDRKIDKLDNDI